MRVLQNMTVNIALILIFLCYPGVTQTVFRFFQTQVSILRLECLQQPAIYMCGHVQQLCKSNMEHVHVHASYLQALPGVVLHRQTSSLSALSSPSPSHSLIALIPVPILTLPVVVI